MTNKTSSVERRRNPGRGSKTYARREEEQGARGMEPRRAGQSVRRRSENKVAAFVIGAILVCMTMVAFALWSVWQQAAPDRAVQTGGVPVTLDMSRTQVVQEDGGANSGGYQQLSDPFLVLVNNQVPLPEGWQVTPNFIGEETVDIRIYNDLNDMFLAAQEDGVSLWVASGYRSVEDQERILNREIENHMRDDGMTQEEARDYSLRTINPPGHSEHHTGFVVDLNDVSDNFEETEAYQWLSQHAAEYGFVQRYRSDKVAFTGIDNESWHYRYVGKEHAQQMEQLDMCLEEYVQYLKDQGVQ